MIKYFSFERNTTHGIKTERTEVYGDSVPSLPTKKYWKSQFKRGHAHFFDEDSPNEVTTLETIGKST